MEWLITRPDHPVPTQPNPPTYLCFGDEMLEMGETNKFWGTRVGESVQNLRQILVSVSLLHISSTAFVLQQGLKNLGVKYLKFEMIVI